MTAVAARLDGEPIPTEHLLTSRCGTHEPTYKYTKYVRKKVLIFQRKKAETENFKF